MVYIDFDGQQLGPVLITKEIQYFEGERPIQWLPVVPINRLRNEELRQYHSQRKCELPRYPSDEHIRQSLADRGKMFLELTEVKHMHFNGVTSLNEELDCAVIVDIEEWFGNSDTKESNKGRPVLKSFIDWQPHAEAQPRGKCECCRESYVVKDSFVGRQHRWEYISGLLPGIASKLPPLTIYPRYREQVNTKDDPLPPDESLIMPCSVDCFVPQLRDFRKYYGYLGYL